MKVVIYMNCIGLPIHQLFQSIDNVQSTYIINYKEMNSNNNMNMFDNVLEQADVFIFQPFNKHHRNEQWHPTNLQKKLNTHCRIVKVNYYRFDGFWKESNYDPSHSEFDNDIDIKYKFDNALSKLKKIDNNSDIKMYKFFVDNYKNHVLFHDCFHPTNYFVNEMFRQILNILKIKDIVLTSVEEMDHNLIIISDRVKKCLELYL
jgi:succinate dehydrogenase flavin-adding protein (antitoxin of CptAB toxin-antitoxin module)